MTNVVINRDGAIARITTRDGVTVALDAALTDDQIKRIATEIDKVAKANYDYGRREQQNQIREALGIGSWGGSLNLITA